MQPRTFLIVLCLLLVQTETAKAGFRTFTGVQGQSIEFTENGVVLNEFNNFWNFGDIFSSTTDGNAYGSAQASVNLLTNAGIRLSSYSRSVANIPDSVSIAAAGWEDVIRVGGSASDTLRIVLQVDGRLSLNTSESSITGADSRVAISLFTDLASPTSVTHVVLPSNDTQLSGFEIRRQSIPGQGTFTDFSDFGNNVQYNAETGLVSWNAIFDLPYSEDQGGYVMNLYATANTHAIKDAVNNTDFGNTIRLISVTNIDGSAVVGGFTFDSGFRLNNDTTANVVPAPGGFLLCGIGAVTLVFGRGMKSRR